MKFLRIFLGLIFPTLVILLLLNQCHSCSHQPEADGGNELPIDSVNRQNSGQNIEEQEDEEVIEQAEEVGNTGDLKVTLLWDFPGDIDLHVVEPNGNEIFFRQPESASGGQLDTDNKIGGQHSAENIYWTNPPKGKYRVFLHYYPSEEPIEQRAGICKVVIFQAGQESRVFDVPMNHVDQIEEVTNIDIQ